MSSSDHNDPDNGPVICWETARSVYPSDRRPLAIGDYWLMCPSSLQMTVSTRLEMI
jgi:hypothetical protein